MQKAIIKGWNGFEGDKGRDFAILADSIEIVEDKPKREVKIGDLGIDKNGKIYIADNETPDYKINWFSLLYFAKNIPETLFNILEIAEEGKKVEDGKTEAFYGSITAEENSSGNIAVYRCNIPCFALPRADFRRFCAQGLVLAREK